MLHRERKLYQGNIMNLSNLVRSPELDKEYDGRALLLIQTHDAAEPSARRYFCAEFGSTTLDDGYTSLYLAVITQDGGYTIENAEKYLEPRAEKHLPPDMEELSFNVLRLPEEMNGMHFQKELRSLDAEDRFFNRWNYGLVSENGCLISYERISDSGEAAREEFGELFGGYRARVSQEQIDALQSGKQLAINVNDEYMLFLEGLER